MAIKKETSNSADIKFHKYRYFFDSNDRLKFDDSYRLKQLPLVNSKHKLSITNSKGLDYNYGKYKKKRISLVLPIEENVLFKSKSFSKINRELYASSFSEKIAWDIIERRINKVHVTLFGGISEESISSIVTNTKEVLSDFGENYYYIGGPFIGNINIGRIYFPAYPIKKNGHDLFSQILIANDVCPSNLHLFGYYNLNDELSITETNELRSIIFKWQDSKITEIKISRIDIIATHDDLVLDSEILESIEINN